MARNRKPKWTMSVVKAMQKPCPKNCPGKYSGVMRDKDGNVVQTYSCEDHCKYKKGA